jgi:type IV secretion system protein TrbD
MAPRTVPIRRAGNRHNLVLGGDRELVMMSGLLAGALIFSAHDVKAALFGICLWGGGLYVLRLMARSDPMLRHVYMRQRGYRPFYPPRSTPFRVNGAAEERQFR